jgi:hypothetical protein
MNMHFTPVKYVQIASRYSRAVHYCPGQLPQLQIQSYRLCKKSSAGIFARPSGGAPFYWTLRRRSLDLAQLCRGSACGFSEFFTPPRAISPMKYSGDRSDIHFGATKEAIKLYKEK